MSVLVKKRYSLWIDERIVDTNGGGSRYYSVRSLKTTLARVTGQYRHDEVLLGASKGAYVILC